MGSIDTVRFRCPACGRAVKVQTKAGDPCGRDFRSNDIPLLIAANLVGQVVHCVGSEGGCDLQFVVRSLLPRRTSCWLEPKQSYRYSALVKVTCVTPLEQCNPEDRELALRQYPVEFLAPNDQMAVDAALDEFHREIPVACLEDFTFEVLNIQRLDPLEAVDADNEDS
jgi:hypothetical protein